MNKKEEYKQKVNKLCKSILNEDLEAFSLGEKLTELDDKSSLTVNSRTLDILFIRENYQINKTMKRLTWVILGLTLINIILVGVTLIP